MKIILPIHTVSEMNTRSHWAVKARRVKEQRTTTYLLICSALRDTFRLSDDSVIRILLTRIGVRRLDTDNLAASFKAVRDGIADAIGIDDGSDRFIWGYAQRRGGPGEYAVEVDLSVESNGTKCS